MNNERKIIVGLLAVIAVLVTLALIVAGPVRASAVLILMSLVTHFGALIFGRKPGIPFWEALLLWQADFVGRDQKRLLPIGKVLLVVSTIGMLLGFTSFLLLAAILGAE